LESILPAKPKSIDRWIWPLTNSSPRISNQSRPNGDNFTKLKTKLNMYDKANLTKIKKMNELAPEVMKAFWAFDKAAVAEGAIPVKLQGVNCGRGCADDAMSLLHRNSQQQRAQGRRD